MTGYEFEYADIDMAVDFDVHDGPDTYPTIGERKRSRSVSAITRSLDPEFYRREAARNAQIAEQLEGIPTVDNFNKGQAVTFEKVYPNTEEVYQFAAVKFNDQFWAVTGARQVGSVYTWTQLLDFIGLSNLGTVNVVTAVYPLKLWNQKQIETEMPPVTVDAE